MRIKIIFSLLAVCAAVFFGFTLHWAINYIGNFYKSCTPEITMSYNEFKKYSCQATTAVNVYKCPTKENNFVCVKVNN